VTHLGRILTALDKALLTTSSLSILVTSLNLEEESELRPLYLGSLQKNE
jgi:hypothetical protein